MSPQKEAQDADERRDLDAFLAFAGIRAEGIVRGGDSPDFYIEVDGRRIAVEHTEFNRSHEERGRSAAWFHLRDAIDARRKGDDLLEHTQVTIWFRKHTEHPISRIPSRKDRGRFIDELFAAVRKERLSSGHVEVRTFPGSPVVDTYCESLSIWGGPGWHQHWTDSAEHGFFGGSENVLYNAFAKKFTTDRPPVVDENWLLMVASGVMLSQMLPSVGDDSPLDVPALNDALDGSAFDVAWLLEMTFSKLFRWTPSGGWVRVPGATSR